MELTEEQRDLVEALAGSPRTRSGTRTPASSTAGPTATPGFTAAGQTEFFLDGPFAPYGFTA
jgi:hypothetical protein